MAGRYVPRKPDSGGSSIEKWNGIYARPFIFGVNSSELWHTAHLEHLLGKVSPDFKAGEAAFKKDAKDVVDSSDAKTTATATTTTPATDQNSQVHGQCLHVWDVETKSYVWVPPHQVAIRFHQLNMQYDDSELYQNMSTTPTILGNPVEPHLIKWNSCHGSTVVPFDFPLAVPKRPTAEGKIPFSDDSHSTGWMMVNYAKLWVSPTTNVAPDAQHICTLLMNVLHSIAVEFFTNPKEPRDPIKICRLFRLAFQSACVWFNLYPEILGPLELLLKDSQPTDNLERSLALLLQANILSLGVKNKITKEEECLRLETLLRSILLRWYKHTLIPGFKSTTYQGFDFRGRGGRGGRGGHGRGRGRGFGRGSSPGSGYKRDIAVIYHKKPISFLKHPCNGLFLCMVLLKKMVEELPETKDSVVYKRAVDYLQTTIKRISDVSDVLDSLSPLNQSQSQTAKDDLNLDHKHKKDQASLAPPGGLEFTRIAKHCCAVDKLGVFCCEAFDSKNQVHVAGVVLARIMRTFGFPSITVQMMCDFYEKTLEYAHQNEMKGAQVYKLDLSGDKSLYHQLKPESKDSSLFLDGSGFTLDKITKSGFARPVAMTSTLVEPVMSDMLQEIVESCALNRKLTRTSSFKISSSDPIHYVGVELGFLPVVELLKSAETRIHSFAHSFKAAETTKEGEKSETSETIGSYVMRSQVLEVVVMGQAKHVLALVGKHVNLQQLEKQTYTTSSVFYIHMKETAAGPQHLFYEDAACSTTPFWTVEEMRGLPLSLLFKNGPLVISIVDTSLLFL
jgi:hypothetical protein